MKLPWKRLQEKWSLKIYIVQKSSMIFWEHKSWVFFQPIYVYVLSGTGVHTKMVLWFIDSVSVFGRNLNVFCPFCFRWMSIMAWNFFFINVCWIREGIPYQGGGRHPSPQKKCKNIPHALNNCFVKTIFCNVNFLVTLFL